MTTRKTDDRRLTPAQQRAATANRPQPKLHRITDDEKFTPSTEWVKDTAHSTFAVRHTKNDPRYKVAIAFDFGGLTTDDYKELAMSEVRIRTQARLRAMSPDVWHTLTKVSVKDDLMTSNRQRGPVDRWARMRRDMAAVGTPESVIEQTIAALKAAQSDNGQEAIDNEVVDDETADE